MSVWYQFLSTPGISKVFVSPVVRITSIKILRGLRVLLSMAVGALGWGTWTVILKEVYKVRIGANWANLERARPGRRLRPDPAAALPVSGPGGQGKVAGHVVASARAAPGFGAQGPVPAVVGNGQRLAVASVAVGGHHLSGRSVGRLVCSWAVVPIRGLRSP